MKCSAPSWRAPASSRARNSTCSNSTANNPQAQAEIRAPLFEDKVVDFIAELAQVTDRKVDRETLFADPDDAVQSDKAGDKPCRCSDSKSGANAILRAWP